MSISGLTVVKKRDFIMKRPPTECAGAEPWMRRPAPKLDQLLDIVRAFFWHPTHFCSPKIEVRT